MKVNVETDVNNGEWQRKIYAVEGHAFKVVAEKFTSLKAYVEVWDAAGLHDRAEVDLDQAEKTALKTVFNEVKADCAEVAHLHSEMVG